MSFGNECNAVELFYSLSSKKPKVQPFRKIEDSEFESSS